jgi:hypothetical protein
MNSIDRKICDLAESLLMDSEFTISRTSSFPDAPMSKITISHTCVQQNDRTIVEEIITSSIVESDIEIDASTTYVVEVLALVSIVPDIRGDRAAIVYNDINEIYKQSFTLTIWHHPDGSNDSPILLDFAFQPKTSVA